MKNKLVVIGLAIALSAPAGVLLASAGDSTVQGANGTTTGTPASSVKTKKHHGHHHKKTTAPAATTAPATK